MSQNCSYSQATHQVTCSQGTLPAGASVTFIVDIQFSGSVGDITNSASASSTTTDPNPGNNTDLLKLKVKGGSGKGLP